jgi:hypothetical protein
LRVEPDVVARAVPWLVRAREAPPLAPSVGKRLARAPRTAALDCR